MKKNLYFSGLHTAIITPFKNGKIDDSALEKIVENQIEAQVDGIVPLGSTGESATLSPTEHRETIKRVIEIVDGRTSVIAGTGSNNTAEAIKYSIEAQEDGASAVLSITPYCNKPSQKGLIAHFEAIASEIDIPLIMYNIPGRTGVYMEPETVIQLSQTFNIVGVKDASSKMEDIRKVIDQSADNFIVLSGNDNETLEMMRYGGGGVIAVSSNVIPEQMRAFIDSIKNEDWDAANQFQAKYGQLFKDLFIETNPLPVKTLMAHLGRCEEEFRLPLVPMYDDTKQQLLNTWEELRIN